jgi:DNA-binding transcriptional ArsR family regulator
MAQTDDPEAVSRLVELVAQLVREKEETKRLIAAFGKGEISSDRIIAELSAQYQLGIGGAVRALAEHDKFAAQQLGERLRSRLDGMLAELTARDATAAKLRPRTSASDTFKDRDDDVLRREFVILKALANRNSDLKSSSIFDAVRAFDPKVPDESITAHLGRLLKAGLIARERKGRYRGLPHGNDYLAALEAEIESRRLPLPVVDAQEPE